MTWRHRENDRMENGYRQQQLVDAPYVAGTFDCDPQNEIQSIHCTRGIDSGTWDWKLTVNGSAEDITIDYDATAAEVQTALEGHTEIVSGDVSCSGGPLPTTSVTVEFQGNLAAKLVPVGQSNISSIVGDSALVLIIRDQRGHPGDAS